MEENNIDLESLLSEVDAIVRSAGEFILSQSEKLSSKDVSDKSVNNLVTVVDKAAESHLVEGLKSILPDSSFITEEKMIDQSQGEYTWIIDPLDGTTNFIHCVPCYSVSVALQKDHEIVAGIVYDICHNNMYSAIKQKGAFKNDVPIHVSSEGDLKNSLIATGFPYDAFEIIEEYLSFLKFLMPATRGIRRLGSAAIDLCYVAEGKFEVFFEKNLEAWDVAAGSLIVREAGGRVSDFSGLDNFIDKKEIVACGNSIYKTFLAELQTFLPF